MRREPRSRGHFAKTSFVGGRRLSESGYNCSSKSGQVFFSSKVVFRENVRPLWFLGRRWAGNDPEAARRLDDGDLFCLAGRDLPATAQEADLSGFLDDPGVMDCKMQIEEFRWWRRTPARASLGDAFLDLLLGC